MIRNKIVYIAALFLFFASPSGSFAQSPNESVSKGAAGFQDIALPGEWEIESGTGSLSIDRLTSPVFVVAPGPLPRSIDSHIKLSYGGALNLRYFSGLSYDQLKKMLPGRTISVTVTIPNESVAKNNMRPSRLKMCVKSEKNGE